IAVAAPAQKPLATEMDGFPGEWKRLAPTVYQGITGFVSRAAAALTPLMTERAEPASTPPAVFKREAMREWREVARRTLIPVAAFSVFVNLLMLTLPIYLFQLSDRVLTSRSHETLMMLTVIAVVFIGVLALLDIVRRQV